ncbi:MAG TPA: aminopeptidase, partial [Caldithrix sp.]|nr:aminopeptidase [Caldithrix sp.]
MIKSLYKKWLKMNLIKKIFIITFLLLISLIISNCNLIFYGIEQGAGQIKILTNAKPIKKFMQDSLYPDSLKQKLILVEQIKKYTIDSLGLNPSKNYNTLYDQKGKDILWVVI